MTQRPLSPHLGVYRFAHTMALSITHRMAGVWMSLGLCVLVYWLMSIAEGELAYERAMTLLSNGYCRVLLLVWLAAFCYHFVNGLRHLLWDSGFGLEKLQLRRSAGLVVVLALGGFLLLAYLFLHSDRIVP